MKLTKALNIEQPFASQICSGALKILVKPHYFFSDDRIAVYATSETQVDQLPQSKIVGSVRVADCVKVDSDRTIQMIAELTSPDYADEFPKSLIPFPKPIYKNHYIWVLENPYLWEMPLELDAEAMINTLWTEIDLDDEFEMGKKTEEEEDKDNDDQGDEGPLMAVQDIEVEGPAHNV